MNIAIIICTKDRPKDLGVILKSLVVQSVKLNEVIIVDGSDQSVESVATTFRDVLPIKYWHVRPPGLTKQRNFGISKLDSGTDWVGFLDDDLELDENCLKNLVTFIKTREDVKGVGLCIKNQRDLKKSFLREIMLLDKYPGGQVTLSGAAAAIRPFESSVNVEWVYGGATFWKKEILDEFKFDEWFSGVGYCEDLDFSYRVSRKYPLAICADAKCDHHHKDLAISRVPLMGEWLVVAWWYFAHIKNSFNLFFLLWGIFFMTMNNLVLGIIKFDQRKLQLFRGNLKGWLKIILGEVANSKGFQK